MQQCVVEMRWPLKKKGYLRWWFQIFLFSPLFREDSHFDEYFSKGLKPPARYGCGKKPCFNQI